MAWQKAALVGVGAFVVLGSLMVPATAGSPQSLVGTGTAVGISSDLNKRAGSNALGARDRAKGVAQDATDRNRLADEVMDDGSQGSPVVASGGSSEAARPLEMGEFMARFKQDGEKAEAELAGQWVSVTGVVVATHPADGGSSFVFLLPENAKGMSGPAYVVRISGPADGMEKGSVKSFVARFDYRRFAEAEKSYIYYLDAAETTGAAPAAGSASGGPGAEPEVPFSGWRFLGSVQDAGGATGVFMKDGQTLYAQAGDKLDDSVKVESLGAGSAVLKSGKASQTVLPW